MRWWAHSSGMRSRSDTFNDGDGDALTYTATKADGSPLPTWLSFDASTRTFSGIPATAGTVAVKVTASDGDASISDEFNVVVRAAGLGHCRPSDPLEIWCASLTVGALGGDPYGYQTTFRSGRCPQGNSAIRAAATQSIYCHI